jgi:hypothetical protein
MEEGMKTIILVLSLFFLTSCQTCRVTSCEDAKYYKSQGYQTRIAVYKTGLDGKLYGAFIWDYHAQAQVKMGNEWKWAGNFGLSDTPSFSVKGDIYYWQPEIYEAFLKQQGVYR